MTDAETTTRNDLDSMFDNGANMTPFIVEGRGAFQPKTTKRERSTSTCRNGLSTSLIAKPSIWRSTVRPSSTRGSQRNWKRNVAAPEPSLAGSAARRRG